MTSLVFLSLAALGASSFIAPGPLAFERGVGIPSTPIGSRGFTPVDHWRSIRQACSSPCFGGCCNSGGPCCPWMACCPVGYVCAPINGKNGCCPEGQNCTTIAPNACQQPGYVQCSGANLCCRKSKIPNRQNYLGPT
ncbi:hypothetical protein BOTBODRAFT_337954 [Botryobasidium botryosum FD-172 SS1]|uniref:Granulins domain-containing protein n=1 Tax=Botryobasidium botryosum (strain FD-172 SS1) TaxID=930990 RepID=A0A067MS05_BOTB1|nr:hypothetical protein BOTBODRAFT_337954 [Botryobasidium botryosum FD-172 SS1]